MPSLSGAKQESGHWQQSFTPSGVLIAVGVSVPVGVSVDVSVGAAVTVELGIAVSVGVGVPVLVAAKVCVLVAMITNVGDGVAVGVGVCVWLGVATLAPTQFGEAPTTAMIVKPRRQARMVRASRHPNQPRVVMGRQAAAAGGEISAICAATTRTRRPSLPHAAGRVKTT